MKIAFIYKGAENLGIEHLSAFLKSKVMQQNSILILLFFQATSLSTASRWIVFLISMAVL